MNLIPWDRGKSMKTHMLTKAVFLGWLMIPLLVATVSGAEDRGGGAKQGRNSAKATFAGGCFWCMESPFDQQDGVLSVTAGYPGGQEKNPVRYKIYRYYCGRDHRLRQPWGGGGGGALTPDDRCSYDRGSGDIDHPRLRPQLLPVPEGVGLRDHFVDQTFGVVEVAEVGGVPQAGGGAAGQLPLLHPVDAEVALPGVADGRMP